MMSTPEPTPVPGPPRVWADPPVRLYHGTSASAARSILADGIDLGVCKAYTDFGPGFYLTTVYQDAVSWAYSKHQGMVQSVALAVIEFAVPRGVLAPLETLWFVRGAPDAEDLWSFIFYCRAGRLDHGRGEGEPAYYDVVAGPVAVPPRWQQRAVIPGADQVSWHTPRAVALLNGLIRQADPAARPQVHWIG